MNKEEIKKEAINKANERETLTDEDGRDYYMVGDKKIYEMEIRSEQDRRIADNIVAFRMSGFSRPSDML